MINHDLYAKYDQANRLKKCLACYLGPPTLKSDAIKKLGTDLCNLDPSELTVDSLQMKEAQPNGQNKWLSNSRPSK